MIKKCINWLYVLLWMCVIFYFSSQPNLKSDLPNMWDFIFRKIAHMSEFFVLSYLLFRALREYRLRPYFLMLLVFITSIAYAFIDEVHQTFIVRRSGNIFDVCIDSVGVVMFIVLLHIHKKKYFV